MKKLPNIITGSRILLSVALLFCPPLSAPFYAVYLAAGGSDILDGFLARRLNAATPLGAKLDTAADLSLVAVCLIRLLPVLNVPRWLVIWIAVIALIKIVNLVSGFVIKKQFVALHTVMNKVTGALLFLLPLTLAWIDLRCSAAVVCAVATFAAVQEGHFIRTGRVS
jgi:CDP-diacylglycerol--glycerol-3-phosphate 3-phosphatidyltransferase